MEEGCVDANCGGSPTFLMKRLRMQKMASHSLKLNGQNSVQAPRLDSRGALDFDNGSVDQE